ncbi:MAG: AfsR/SARP family transcriptional regulator, partial [Acidimicrobiales bacterium]
RAPNIASVVQRMERRVRERRALLDIVKRSTNAETRMLEGGDAWDLCVVICMQRATDAEVDATKELVDLAGDGTAGLAVIICSTARLKARTRITADSGPLLFESGSGDIVEPSHSPIWPQGVESGVAAGVSSLLKAAGDLEGVRSEITDGDTITTNEAATGSVEVRILGPVDVMGAARPFTRAWALELVVYLALHRKGATTDKWSAALWPERLMAPASLHSTASAARRALGTSASGEDHLPRSHGRLALADSVTTDWERFVSLSHSDQPEKWPRAIELVRGRPFEGLRAVDWALMEGITALIEAEVVDVSSRYAEYSLGNCDPAGAEWVSRQALRVSPYDERMYRFLMRAADAAGHPAGVESVMEELVHLVAEEVEPYDAVHPETLELYRALSRRPFMAGRAGSSGAR